MKNVSTRSKPSLKPGKTSTAHTRSKAHHGMDSCHIVNVRDMPPTGWAVRQEKEDEAMLHAKNNAPELGEVVSDKPKALSLYSGADGLGLGFAQAGFNVVAGVEMDHAACETHRSNLPETKMFEGDVRERRAEVVSYVKKNGVDVVFGGPPCVGFSTLGQRDPHDPRNRLVLEFLRYVDDIKPKAFVMENVQGILTQPLDGHLAADLIVKKAAEMGYHVEHRLLCAADYGVPQMRKRVIFIGTRTGAPILFPEPTHGPDGSGLKPYVTVREAIGDLEGKEEDEAFGHTYHAHSPDLVARIKGVQAGQCLYKRNHGYRLDPDMPAKTITKNNGSTVIHYGKDFMISNREMARLQKFEDHHVFGRIPVSLAYPHRPLRIEAGMFTSVDGVNATPPETGR